jgi:hypothetical protein
MQTASSSNICCIKIHYSTVVINTTLFLQSVGRSVFASDVFIIPIINHSLFLDLWKQVQQLWKFDGTPRYSHRITQILVQLL